MSGNVKLSCPAGGSVTISAADTASNLTATIPAATDTLVNLASTQTLTNKTLTSAGSNSVEATSGPTSTQLAGNRNKIINGAMMIDQRFAGGAIGAVTGSAYTIDRWRIIRVGGTSTLTPQQSTVAPAGFTNSLIVTVGSGATPATSEERSVGQVIEGLNVADLGWGSAGASSVTLSFWVRSSVTGTFGVVFGNSGASRSYVASYTINAANTWEYKTITIPGDTAGTWLTNNGTGLVLFWDLGVGPTYSGSATGSWQASALEGLTGGTKLSATTGATFYITGVQLEKGATATPFENRLYGTELALCQRYYTTVGGDSANQVITMLQAYSTTQTNGGTVPFPIKMRSAPTFTYSALSDIYIQGATSAAITPTALSTGAAEGSTMCGVIRATVASGLAAGNAVSVFTANTNARLNFSAEL